MDEVSLSEGLWAHGQPAAVCLLLLEEEASEQVRAGARSHRTCGYLQVWCVCSFKVLLSLTCCV